MHCWRSCGGTTDNNTVRPSQASSLVGDGRGDSIECRTYAEHKPGTREKGS